MKIHILSIIFASSITICNAQDAFEGMRNANDQQYETARFSALGGAMGALGGDFSAINVNPAGSVIFSNSQAAGTLNNDSKKNTSNYFGNNNNSTQNNFNLNQAGAVWVFTDINKSDWKKISFAINYEKTNNLADRTLASGINPNNSIANYFLSYANGIPINTIIINDYEDLFYAEQQAFLGYEGYIISPITGSSNNGYKKDILATNNFFQENKVQSRGYNSKINFNLASSYKDKIYLGINLNAHFSDYNRNATFFENYANATNNNPNLGVQNIQFNNDLYTYGTGFSLQLGAIAKLTKNFRAGLAYDSPTWFTLNDELTQTLKINCTNCGTQPNNFSADPNIKMVYPSYKLRTPAKTTASLAYVFGKKGLISFDYTMRNFSKTEFKPTKDYTNTNSEMKTAFAKKTDEIRIGGEYRIKQFSLRAGYRTQQSPYKDQKTIANLTSYSGGLGYAFGNKKLDLSYTTSQRNSQQQFFSQGLVDRANLNTQINNIALTLVLEL